MANEGQQAYENITQGAGFLRHFFNLLKGATGGQISGLNRLFITGVSPVTMDDVTSGFNIGKNISLSHRFNEMIGFTEDEVVEMATYYEQSGLLPIPLTQALPLMKTWYNNYYFGRRAKTPMYGSDMVLYFLLQSQEDDGVPDDLIDTIELKYMSQSAYDKEDGKENFQKLITDAREQLDKYANDPRIAEVAQQVTFKRLVLAYRGWELAHAEEMVG